MTTPNGTVVSSGPFAEAVHSDQCCTASGGTGDMAFLLGLREACTETVVETTSKGLAWDAATDMCTETFEDRTTWTTSTGDLIAGPTASDRVESVSADRCCRQGVDEAEGLA